MVSNIQFITSCQTDQWFTPDNVLTAVRSVFGDIELDPASSHEVNKRVRAYKIYDRDMNGLIHPWKARSVFCNPPGGKINGKSLPTAFWLKLMAERDGIGHAIFLAYSIEQLQTSQNKGCPSMMDFPTCIPKRRLQFINESAKNAAHANAIIYVPGQVDKTDCFKNVFREIGAVR